MVCMDDDVDMAEAAAADDACLLPFALALSCFSCLSELHWQHHPRAKDPCDYADALAASLRQLVSLQALVIDTGVCSKYGRL